MVTPSGTSWVRSPIADSIIRVNTQTVALGARSAGFALRGVTLDTDDQRLQLNATFELASASLRVIRHYAIASGSPTFEVWNTYEPLNESPIVDDLNALQLVVQQGNIRSLTGLKGDNADVAGNDVFTLQQQALVGNAVFTIGSEARSSESFVPWIAVDSARDEFYLALMWSGSWSLTVNRTNNGLSVAAGLGSMSRTLKGTPVDGPHAVFGAVRGGLPQASDALRAYIVNGIRGGRGFSPLVTYNTWFAYGTNVTEANMMAAIDAAAGVGAELFVIDAGWYAGAGADGAFDFDSGLGSWTPDPGRFPNGLRPLRDHAHDLGLKFGVWVEPERIALALVGDSTIDEQWLATHDGQYGTEDSAIICLSNDAAKSWILGWLTTLVDSVQPDYLKWDNNLWTNCNRPGHEHGASDGNFAQVNGLYEVLSTLRQQYPDLLIENVSGGGNRMDLGLMRYSDVAWMDDRTAPSSHVRHNLEGLSAVFPPAYLLSFVTDHATEPLHDAPDMSLYMRSRMPGVLGLCFLIEDFSEGELATLSHEIDIYKGLRGVLPNAAGALLTMQAESTPSPEWDVMQISDSGAGSSFIGAFQTDTGVDQINVKPVGLDPSATYSVVSVDTGLLGEASGADLMSGGIDILQSPNSAAHLLIVSREQ
jgi:alpha-galactosidase